MTRVALTKGSLRIPPTYFAVQHALELADEFEFEFFTMVADIADAEIAERIRIHDASDGTPFESGRRAWSQRERAIPLLFRRARRQLRDWAPHLIHQHFANWSQLAVSSAESLRVPMLLTLHGADVYVPLTPLSERSAFGKPTLRWHQRTVRRAFDEAARVLAVSEYLADVAVTAGADARRLAVHYQGIDTDLYRPSERTADAPPRVVFVGALSQAKGIQDLVTASVEIARTTPHELVIVGDGPLRGSIEQIASEQQHIEVRGQLDRQGVRAALAGATVFVLPTQKSGRWREAAGLVSLEAQASGVPAIVYDSGGAAEMLSDGNTGIVVEEGNIGALADAIRSVIELPGNEWSAMSARAREFVVAERSLRASAQELSAHYLDMTGN